MGHRLPPKVHVTLSMANKARHAREGTEPRARAGGGTATSALRSAATRASTRAMNTDSAEDHHAAAEAHRAVLAHGELTPKQRDHHTDEAGMHARVHARISAAAPTPVVHHTAATAEATGARHGPVTGHTAPHPANPHHGAYSRGPGKTPDASNFRSHSTRGLSRASDHKLGADSHRSIGFRAGPGKTPDASHYAGGSGGIRRDDHGRFARK